MSSKSKSKLTIPSKSLSKSARSDLVQSSSSSIKKGKKRAHPDNDPVPLASDEDEDGLSNVSGFSGGEDEFDLNEEVLEGEEGGVEEMDVDGEEDSELNTDDEIELSKLPKKKSKKNTKKNKLPTSADTFGETLASLLAPPESSTTTTSTSDPTLPPLKKQKRKTLPSSSTLTTNPILSLSARAPPQSSAQSNLERRAAKLLKREKEEKEDRARVVDVLEGWGSVEGERAGGQEWERGLRKVAQRGVIKLFNTILAASSAHPTLTGSAAVNNERQSRKEKDNVLGRGGKEERLTKEGFLDMIKSGGK